MLTLAGIICCAGLAMMVGATIRLRQARLDEGRMAGYIASLKSVAAQHRARIVELEVMIADRDRVAVSQDRLIEGQAAHLRKIEGRYAG